MSWDEQMFVTLSEYVDLNGMTKLLDDTGLLLKMFPAVRKLLKQKYPQDENKIKLWEILQGLK